MCVSPKWVEEMPAGTASRSWPKQEVAIGGRVLFFKACKSEELAVAPSAAPNHTSTHALVCTGGSWKPSDSLFCYTIKLYCGFTMTVLKVRSPFSLTHQWGCAHWCTQQPLKACDWTGRDLQSVTERQTHATQFSDGQTSPAHPQVSYWYWGAATSTVGAAPANAGALYLQCFPVYKLLPGQLLLLLSYLF